MKDDSSTNKSLTEKWPANCDNEIITNDYDYYVLLLYFMLEIEQIEFLVLFRTIITTI